VTFNGDGLEDEETNFNTFDEPGPGLISSVHVIDSVGPGFSNILSSNITTKNQSVITSDDSISLTNPSLTDDSVSKFANSVDSTCDERKLDEEDLRQNFVARLFKKLQPPDEFQPPDDKKEYEIEMEKRLNEFAERKKETDEIINRKRKNAVLSNDDQNQDVTDYENIMAMQVEIKEKKRGRPKTKK